MFKHPNRHLSLTLNSVARTGISLVSMIGPVVENWNRTYDRKAALSLVSMECDGVVLHFKDNHVSGLHWILHLNMVGSEVDDIHVSDACSLLKNAIEKQ